MFFFLPSFLVQGLGSNMFFKEILILFKELTLKAGGWGFDAPLSGFFALPLSILTLPKWNFKFSQFAEKTTFCVILSVLRKTLFISCAKMCKKIFPVLRNLRQKIVQNRAILIAFDAQKLRKSSQKKKLRANFAQKI